MIQDKEIMSAVSKIIQRAEKQADLKKLIATYVDVGILIQLNNKNNKILYGRRGTGKTHILKVLESEIKNESDTIVTVFIDSRALGSSSQFTDTSLSIGKRSLSIYRDILMSIYSALLEFIIDETPENAELALNKIDEFSAAFSSPYTKYTEKSISTTETKAQANKREAIANIQAQPTPNFNVSASKSSELSDSKEVKKEYSVDSVEKIIFPDVYRTLSETLKIANIELFILLDEWASIPQDIQPYLAEHLKRTLLPIQRVSLIIASLGYRSKFSEYKGNSRIGFELGADISVTLDLDDYFVFDRNQETIINTYADILFRHLSIELPSGYLDEHYNVTSSSDLVSKLFTAQKTFEELARAAEGVIRDLMHIFHLAFFEAHRRSRSSIDRKGITDAAHRWFEQDKLDQLDESMHNILDRIVNEVIGKKRARSFLLPRILEKHVMIQKLFDARVIHHIHRGYADKDNPGVRYNIYTLDYGTYVGFIGTSKEPQLSFWDKLKLEEGESIVVPFDDKRSIRRILLKKGILDS